DRRRDGGDGRGEHRGADALRHAEGHRSRHLVRRVPRREERRQERRLAARRGRLVTRAEVREAPLSVDEAVAHVSRPSAGGIAIFVGVVRDENDGRVVTRLEYSAYASMAKREMEAICDEIER